MPATTTRAHAKQSHIEDFGSTEVSTLPAPTRANSKKRAAPSKPTSPQADKKSKQETPASPPTKGLKQEPVTTASTGLKNDKPDESESESETKDIIFINRAPVLDLWASCVTRFMYPDLEWKTCLSAGSAISALCAVAKGKAIGTVGDRSEASKDDSKQKKEGDDTENISVMSFNLQVRDGLVLVGGNRKKDNEEAQRKKFGADEYERLKGVFKEVLSTWKDDREGLHKIAFGFYEKFRPNVAAGQKGWGRKGELSLSKIREVARKST